MPKNKDIKKMSENDLKDFLKNLKESLFNFRFQKSLQQLEHPEQIGRVKKEIARVNTFIRKYELEIK